MLYPLEFTPSHLYLHLSVRETVADRRKLFVSSISELSSSSFVFSARYLMGTWTWGVMVLSVRVLWWSPQFNSLCSFVSLWMNLQQHQNVNCWSHAIRGKVFYFCHWTQQQIHINIIRIFSDPNPAPLLQISAVISKRLENTLKGKQREDTKCLMFSTVHGN